MKKYTIDTLKEIFRKIIHEEEKENQITIDGNIFTIAEYYYSEVFKKKLKLKNPIETINHITAPLVLKGWYDIKDKKLVVLINRIYEFMERIPAEDIPYLVHIYYHEIRHYLQEEKLYNLSKYDNFLMTLEKIIIAKDSLYYKLNHDYFLLEIDAEKYALNKTIEFLKKENLYKENEKRIINRKELINNTESLYNPIDIFEKFNFILQGKIKKHKKDSNNPLEQAYSELKQYLNPTYYENLKIIIFKIYNEDGTFKSIQELMNYQDEIDKKIINLVLKSKSFIKNFKVDNLSEEEIKYMLKVLEEQNEEEIRILEIIKKQVMEDIDLKDYKRFNEKKKLLEIKKIIYLRNLLMNNLLNKKNSKVYKQNKKENLN